MWICEPTFYYGHNFVIDYDSPHLTPAMLLYVYTGHIQTALLHISLIQCMGLHKLDYLGLVGFTDPLAHSLYNGCSLNGKSVFFLYYMFFVIKGSIFN